MSKVKYAASMLAFGLVFSAGAFGHGDDNLNSATRQKLANIHEKMAECLRSDKMVKECKQDMRKNCRETVGKEGCGGTWDSKHGY